jgi:hypothetical protein
MKAPIDLYDIAWPMKPRWVPGDQYVRRLVRAALEPIRGQPPGGLSKVVLNLTLGLRKLGVPFRLHRHLRAGSGGVAGVLHGPREAVAQLVRQRRSVVGPGVLNSPYQWPDLFDGSQAVANLQNCEWAAALYRPVYGDRVRVWAMGIDHERYAPPPPGPRDVDFLVYDKIRWPDAEGGRGLRKACEDALKRAGCSFLYIRYGKYPGGKESAYHGMLRRCRAMLFLTENETQGFAYNEALSMGVPLLAWNCGRWCDPSRFEYKVGDAPATSIPYWDERCGLDFRTAADLPERLGLFLDKLRRGEFRPRDYVLENLRLEQGAERYLALLAAAG